MRVILTEDVFELGRRGEVIRVASGYARNFLIPKRMAVLATQGNLKTAEQQKIANVKKAATDLQEAEILAAELSQCHALVSRKAGESGVLFGSVTAKDLVGLLKKEGIHLDRRKVLMDHPVKSIGNYEIPVRLHSDVETKVLLSVLIEGDEPVLRVKRKDEESDHIVADLNSKVEEMGLPAEGRVVTLEAGPETEAPGPESEASQEAEAGSETAESQPVGTAQVAAENAAKQEEEEEAVESPRQASGEDAEEKAKEAATLQTEEAAPASQGESAGEETEEERS